MRLTQMRIAPDHCQVLLIVPDAEELPPKWPTGREVVVGNSSAIHVSTICDVDGEVTVEVWQAEELPHPHGAPIYDGILLVRYAGVLVGSGTDDNDRTSPPHAAGREPQVAGGRARRAPVLCRRRPGTRVLTTGARTAGALTAGHAPGARAHRVSRWRQHGSAGAAPSRPAGPVGLAPVAPSARPHRSPHRSPRRSRAPAGL